MIPVLVAYANSPQIGMDNLGLQMVYRLARQTSNLAVDTWFWSGLPGKKRTSGQRRGTYIPQRHPASFSLILFSISYELDYTNIYSMLKGAGIEPFSDDRDDRSPLIVAGGFSLMMNPEPVAPFFDLVLIGEAEAMLPGFFNKYRELVSKKRKIVKDELSSLPGVYMPGRLLPRYSSSGIFKGFKGERGGNYQVKRQWRDELGPEVPSCSNLSGDRHFASFNLEVARGCPQGCRFCAASFIYRPFRVHSCQNIINETKEAPSNCRVGLVSSALFAHPEISQIISGLAGMGRGFTLSSMSLNHPVEKVLAQSPVRQNTISLAPETGSRRLARVINKPYCLEELLSRIQEVSRLGAINIKLYLLVGLPGEISQDIEDNCQMIAQARQAMVEGSRKRGKIGKLIISTNPFIPKAATPFQWCRVASPSYLRKVYRRMKKMEALGGISCSFMPVKEAMIQAVLSRGDRRLFSLLASDDPARRIWQTIKSKNRVAEQFDPGIIFKPMEVGTPLPWRYIDHGFSEGFLAKERKRAGQEKITEPCNFINCKRCEIGCHRKS